MSVISYQTLCLFMTILSTYLQASLRSAYVSKYKGAEASIGLKIPIRNYEVDMKQEEMVISHERKENTV